MAAEKAYSPVTLCLDWPKTGRLLLLVTTAFIGTIMNGFFIAAFFVENSLQHVGNVYQACAGIADLIVTTAVLPCCAVVLLSGQWDTQPVCSFLHFIGMASTYCYNVFFMLASIENYLKICRTGPEPSRLKKGYVGMVCVSVFTICFVTAGVGVYLEYDYNYCTRTNHGNFYFKIVTGILFQLITFIVTMATLIAAQIHVRRRALKNVNYKRSRMFDRDNSSTAIHITAYLFFVICWTPYLVLIHFYPDTKDSYFYHFVWLGLSRSVMTSFIYSSLDSSFRRAFAHLFNYCCCKNSLSSYISGHHRRAFEYRSAFSEIRVHILHHHLDALGSSRFSSSSRETHEL